MLIFFYSGHCPTCRKMCDVMVDATYCWQFTEMLRPDPVGATKITENSWFSNSVSRFSQPNHFRFPEHIHSWLKHVPTCNISVFTHKWIWFENRERFAENIEMCFKSEILLRHWTYWDWTRVIISALNFRIRCYWKMRTFQQFNYMKLFVPSM